MPLIEQARAADIRVRGGERAEARRQRRENRGVPYLFLKPSRGAVVGNGQPIVLPWGRNRIDWEVELGVVIGALPDTPLGITMIAAFQQHDEPGNETD